MGDYRVAFICLPSEMPPWHFLKWFKGRNTGHRAQLRQKGRFEVGRMQLPQAESCQAANTEIGKYACWWYLICVCLLCLGSLYCTSVEHSVFEFFIKIGCVAWFHF